jgi:hypothetical protein
MSAGKELTVEQFKLACVADEEFTDEQVWALMQNVVLSSEEDVKEFALCLHEYRPNLEKRFSPKLSIDQGRVYEEIMPGVHLHRRDLENFDDI